MDPTLRSQLTAGIRLTVTQQLPHGYHVNVNEVRGTVVAFAQRPTGSWFAHGQDDKLWLDRLTLRLDDGELTTLILDEYTRIDIEPAAPAAATEHAP